jgi:hypothetical protein
VSDFELKWNGDEYFFAAKKVTEAQMWKAVFEVEKQAKLSFGKGASRINVTSKRGEKSRHRPSSPGFAPNIDNGILKSSVKGIVENIANRSTRETEVVGKIGYDIVEVESGLKRRGVKIKKVSTAVNYGFFLEVGTKNMLPRPWLLPALLKSTPEIMKIFKRATG